MIKYFFLFLLISLTTQGFSQCEEKTMIFEKMQLQGINTDTELLYGYFFYNSSQSELKKLVAKLEKLNYNIAELAKRENKYFLHAEKQEIHNAKSLCKRDQELRELAKSFSIDVYDGWDVGNIDPSKPLITKETFQANLAKLDATELYKRASRFYELHDFSNALIAFDECIQKDIYTDTSYFKLGVCFLETQNLEQGLNCWKKAIDINPKYFKAAFNLGATYYDLGNYTESVHFYKKVIEIEPSNDAALYGIAASEYMNQHIDQAKIYCDKALKVNPKNSNAIQLKQMMGK
ncbi:MAG: hypothetical protein CMO01_25095 [Thalassobius sp.]|nr:hypothetical protein [Thalassovita sp.]